MARRLRLSGPNSRDQRSIDFGSAVKLLNRSERHGFRTCGLLAWLHGGLAARMQGRLPPDGPHPRPGAWQRSGQPRGDLSEALHRPCERRRIKRAARRMTRYGPMEGERELTAGLSSKDAQFPNCQMQGKCSPRRRGAGPSSNACWSGGLFPRQRLIHSLEPKSVDNPVNILPCGQTVTA